MYFRRAFENVFTIASSIDEVQYNKPFFVLISLVYNLLTLRTGS